MPEPPWSGIHDPIATLLTPCTLSRRPVRAPREVLHKVETLRFLVIPVGEVQAHDRDIRRVEPQIDGAGVL